MSDPVSPLDDVKRRVLEAALPLVPFDGWTDRMLREAGKAESNRTIYARNVELNLDFEAIKTKRQSNKNALLKLLKGTGIQILPCDYFFVIIKIANRDV